MNRSALTVRDHSRDAAGLTYVYPVISRRAGGFSIGINLNPNNACNWRCLYCQVPALKRGIALPVDLQLLEDELSGFLHEIYFGNFFERAGVPPEKRQVRDIALSGNGEPTSAAGFAQVVKLIAGIRTDAGLGSEVKTVLITNGSQIQRETVRAGLSIMNRIQGEVWFKIDGGKREDLQRINNVNLSIERVTDNLRLSAASCNTWIQTCAFALDGHPAADYEAYLDFIRRITDEQLPVAGVLLYSPVRDSMQEEAGRLSALPAPELESLAANIRACGLAVKLSV